MLSGFWKFAALSVVVGVCSLVVVNVYGQLNQLNQLKQPLVHAGEISAEQGAETFPELDLAVDASLPPVHEAHVSTNSTKVVPGETAKGPSSSRGLDFRLAAYQAGGEFPEADPTDDEKQSPVVRSQSANEPVSGPALVLPPPTVAEKDSAAAMPTPPVLPDLDAQPLTRTSGSARTAQIEPTKEASGVAPRLLEIPDAQPIPIGQPTVGEKTPAGSRIQQTSGIQNGEADPFADAFPADLPPLKNSAPASSGREPAGAQPGDNQQPGDMQPYRRPSMAPSAPPAVIPEADPFGLDTPATPPAGNNSRDRLPSRNPSNRELPTDSGLPANGSGRTTPPTSLPVDLDVELGLPSQLPPAGSTNAPATGRNRNEPDRLRLVEPAIGPDRDFPGDEVPRTVLPPRNSGSRDLENSSRTLPADNDPFGSEPVRGRLPQDPRGSIRDDFPQRRPVNEVVEPPFDSSNRPARPAVLPEPGAAAEPTARAVEQPRVVIEKQAPASAVLGQSLIYSVVVKNEGTVAARQVIVEDRIPKGTQLTGTAPQAEISDKRLIWKLGTLTPGETRTIQVRVTPVEEGQIGSVARVSFVSEVAAEIVVAAAEIDLRSDVPAEVTLGKTFEMTFRVKNLGKNTAKNVIVRDLLPEGIDHPAGKDVEYLVGDLAPGESHDVLLEVVPTRVGRLKNQVTVLAQGMRPIEALKEIVVLGSGLAITHQVPSRAIVGRPARFDNLVQNQGSAVLRNIKVVEEIPTGYDFADASEGGDFDTTTRTVSWEIRELPPGATRTLSTRLTARQTGEVAATVSAISGEGAKATVSATAKAEGLPSITIIPMNEEKLIAVGERVHSRLVVKNRGSAPAQSVALAIDIPPGLKLISVDGPVQHTQQGSRIIFQIPGSVAAGAELPFELELEASREGDNPIGVQVVAENMLRPLHRDDVIQVITDPAAPGSNTAGSRASTRR
ncbi:conserved repeat domain protein [Planctopirus limnophila DSM 3776]|uniref:Conserved repeat domain protein n=1 Tax=Planctopirus limnophila (strain ATCC 43296 / DSM 3776 / IFAM 1008 / Mu 290) TaxID=521674 RepID=D5SR64_PLAL2|nr:DUF11 domain-containing protein [Planctopirus limnophila]ADG66532.1 conserved repeat domain protein [Planctopirus limnophila DSM 3776]